METLASDWTADKVGCTGAGRGVPPKEDKWLNNQTMLG